MTVIEIQRFSKHFNGLKAVDRIDLAIRKGEIFGLLGPNGAGKTTTIRVLCGLSMPTGGRISVMGRDSHVDSKAVRRLIGVVPQGNVLDRDLTLRQNLAYHAKLYGMDAAIYSRKIREVMGLMGMGDRLDDEPLTLSGGMKRRVTIAKALIHDPKVLVLDEPTTGLDPQSRHVVWQTIRSLKKRGITILLTTHYMEEADALCDRVAIIDRGRIVARGTPSELKERLSRGDVFELRFKGKVDLSDMLASGLAERVETDGPVVRVTSRRRKEAMAHLMAKYGDRIETVNVRPPTLEDVFLEKTGRKLREPARGGRAPQAQRINQGWG